MHPTGAWVKQIMATEKEAGRAFNPADWPNEHHYNSQRYLVMERSQQIPVGAKKDEDTPIEEEKVSQGVRPAGGNLSQEDEIFEWLASSYEEVNQSDKTPQQFLDEVLANPGVAGGKFSLKYSQQ